VYFLQHATEIDVDPARVGIAGTVVLEAGYIQVDPFYVVGRVVNYPLLSSSQLL